MAKKTNSQANPEKGNQSPLIVNTQYIKDLSFENPSTSHNEPNKEPPAISVHIEAQARNIVDRSFEVSLRIQVDAKHKETNVFLLDLDYAGVFTIGEQVPEDYLRPILMVECPRILFPFARQVVASIIQEGGYPTLLLTPVDFADLYQRQAAQEQQAQKEKEQSTEQVQ